MKVGDRVRIDNPATAPQTGVGRTGTIEAIVQCESSVTGALLRWTNVDVRLDSGALVTREPRQLQIVATPRHAGTEE